LRGVTPESGEEGVPLSFTPWSEVYTVRNTVWKQAGMEGWGGCLCIGCLEKRIGRQLTPKDFDPKHAFNTDEMPGTVRLLSRRMGHGIINHADGMFVVCGGEATPVKTEQEAGEMICKWAEAGLWPDVELVEEE
jgi:hypothetical protein